MASVDLGLLDEFSLGRRGSGPGAPLGTVLVLQRLVFSTFSLRFGLGWVGVVTIELFLKSSFLEAVGAEMALVST